ncbi:MAG: RNA methyltransferase [Bacteroidota bacterium]
MLTRNQNKLITSLRLQKYRNEEGLFIAEGVKLVDELLGSKFTIHQIFATSEWIDAGHIPQNRYLVEIFDISQAELERISALGTPNQVLAVAQIPAAVPVPDITGEWVLLLDQLRDPGNLGTIIRTADWFGINRIIAAFNSVEVWNPKVVQSSMGSVFRMPVHYTDIRSFLAEVPEQIPVYGTLLEGEPISKVQFKHGGIVIIGNESHGISEQIKPFITNKVTIASATKGMSGKAESLNASIASAILCYEIRRQHPE